jgi:hypothetical protein
MKKTSKIKEKKLRISWKRSHEYFCLEEYDAGESPSSLNEAWWKMTQQPTQHILNWFGSQGGSTTLILTPFDMNL